MLKELKNFGGYVGHVKLQVKHGTKTVKTIEAHNAGTASLFKYIADCLSGATSSNIDPTKKPGRLKISSANSVIGTISVPYSDIKKAVEVGVEENPYAYYGLQFTVPMSMLNEGMVLEQLRLYSLDGNRQYANIDLSEGVKIETTNTSLVVEWQLGFMNK